MGMFDDLAAGLGGLDLNALAAKAGLSPEQVQQGLGAMGRAAPKPEDTAGAAAAETGLPIEKLQALLSQVGGEEMVATVSGLLGGGGRLHGAGGTPGKP